MNDKPIPPLREQLRALRDEGFHRFHMPGHKGRLPAFPELSGLAALDFTELDACGVPQGECLCLSSAHERAARYFGAPAGRLLTGGGTEGLFAALFLLRRRGTKILADRNCHTSAHRAMALLGLTPVWIHPDRLPGSTLTGDLPEEGLLSAYRAHPDAVGLLVTSPTYYGVRLDLARYAGFCEKRGLLLLVDEAHGAHFPALSLPSAVEAGAHLAVSSAHKTLPAVNQGAFLLSRRHSGAELDHALDAVGRTTSPCYPLLSSVEEAVIALSPGGELREKYAFAARAAKELRRLVREETPFTLPVDRAPLCDPCRLTVCVSSADFTGPEAAHFLYQRGVVCEMADSDNLVFILTCSDGADDFASLGDGLLALAHEKPAGHARPAPYCPRPEVALSLPETLHAGRTSLPLGRAAGRIAGQSIAPYPPGVPLVAAGEILSENIIATFLALGYNGDEEISIISSNPKEESR